MSQSYVVGKALNWSQRNGFHPDVSLAARYHWTSQPNLAQSYSYIKWEAEIDYLCSFSRAESSIYKGIETHFMSTCCIIYLASSLVIGSDVEMGSRSIKTHQGVNQSDIVDKLVLASGEIVVSSCITISSKISPKHFKVVEKETVPFFQDG